MAENLKQKNIEIKRIGVYIIIILALIRFLIYPLHASLREKKVLLGEWSENYRIKSQVFERGGKDMRIVVEKSALSTLLYDKGVSNSYIQSAVLEWVIKFAEKKGLTVINFEMLEPIAGKGKGISEIPILVRLKGRPDKFNEILEGIERAEKVLSIRSMEITKSGQDQVFSLTISAFRVEI